MSIPYITNTIVWRVGLWRVSDGRYSYPFPGTHPRAQGHQIEASGAWRLKVLNRHRSACHQKRSGRFSAPHFLTNDLPQGFGDVGLLHR